MDLINSPDKANLWNQAGEAAARHDWPLLNHYLGQMLHFELSPEEAVSTEIAAATLHTSELERSLTLALQVLEFGDFQTKWDVAKLFPGFGEPAIAPLIALIQDELADLECRWFAARILGQFDHPLAIQGLIALLQNSTDEDLSSMAADALSAIGATAIAALAELLQRPETRLSAVRSLTQMHHAEILEPLLSVVNDTDATIRVMVIEAISSCPDPRIPPVLIQALQDPVAQVRRAAISGLGTGADLATQLGLVDLLGDRLLDLNLQVCQQAAVALGRIGSDAAVALLSRQLRSPNAPLPLKLEIVRALGWAGSATALDSLQQVLASEDETIEWQSLYQEIVMVLGRWAEFDLKPEAAQVLVQVLHQQHHNMPARTKQAIALALGQLGQPLALDPLINLLADEDAGVRLHAIAALKTLDASLAYQRLETLATQTDLAKPLQQGVAVALQEWGIGARD